MKKLFIAFTLVFLTASFSNQLLAQTKTCTPEQIAACKKVCGDKVAANCSVAQKTACQKVCNNSSEAKVASYDGFKIPVITNATTTKTASCQKKMTSCTPASSVKLTKIEKASCIKHDTKIVKNKEESVAPIAQKVALETTASNN